MIVLDEYDLINQQFYSRPHARKLLALSHTPALSRWEKVAEGRMRMNIRIISEKATVRSPYKYIT
jgi:hypothetical protein